MRRPAPVYSEGKTEYKLPAAINREVGRIIVTWAFFEHVIKSILKNLQTVDDAGPKRDRTLLEELNLIRDLLSQRGTPLDNRLFERSKNRALLAEGRRNLVAHGRWRLGHDAKWRVILSRGWWPKEAFNKRRVSRRDRLESITVDVVGLRSVTAAIEILIAGARELRDKIDAAGRGLSRSNKHLTRP